MAWKEAVAGDCTLQAGWMQPPCFGSKKKKIDFKSQVKHMHASGPA